ELGLHRLRRGPVAGVGVLRRLAGALLVAQVAGQLGLQASLERCLDQGGYEPAVTGQLDLASVDLLEQGIQLPGGLQLLDQILARGPIVMLLLLVRHGHDCSVPLGTAYTDHLTPPGDTDWYRILTDPHTGKFLPLPAEKYRPTTAQLEYLRLVDPICAMPGCTRPTSCNCEGDHIDAFHHALLRLGGRTCILNMHMLCWTHHRLKTLGLLNATRIPATNPQPPGRITPTATAAGTRDT